MVVGEILELGELLKVLVMAVVVIRWVSIVMVGVLKYSNPLKDNTMIINIVESALLFCICMMVINVLGGIYRKTSIVLPSLILSTLIIIYVSLIRYPPVIRDSVVF